MGNGYDDLFMVGDGEYLPVKIVEELPRDGHYRKSGPLMFNITGSQVGEIGGRDTRLFGFPKEIVWHNGRARFMGNDEESKPTRRSVLEEFLTYVQSASEFKSADFIVISPLEFEHDASYLHSIKCKAQGAFTDSRIRELD